MLIDKVAHFPGHHCASTGIRNLVNFHGIPWSEEMCFGIGCGLGIWYLDFPGMSPSRLIHVRSEDIESQFFNRIGFPFQWEQFDDPADSETALINKLNNGLPVMLQTDIYYLKYYNSTTHFPGHVVTAWGYDLNKKVFYISDTEREGLLEVPFSEIKKARYSNDGFFLSKGNLVAPQNISFPVNIPEIILKAIRDNSKKLLDEDNDFAGIVALKKWENELSEWVKFKDWSWTVRFTYQVIEKRGTGGGAFRLLYSRFLEEAVQYLPQIKTLRLPELMAEVASAWADLAKALKDLSSETKFEPREVLDKLTKVKDIEEAYHRKAITLQED